MQLKLTREQGDRGRLEQKYLLQELIEEISGSFHRSTSGQCMVSLRAYLALRIMASSNRQNRLQSRSTVILSYETSSDYNLNCATTTPRDSTVDCPGLPKIMTSHSKPNTHLYLYSRAERRDILYHFRYLKKNQQSYNKFLEEFHPGFTADSLSDLRPNSPENQVSVLVLSASSIV